MTFHNTPEDDKLHVTPTKEGEGEIFTLPTSMFMSGDKREKDFETIQDKNQYSCPKGKSEEGSPSPIKGSVHMNI